MNTQTVEEQVAAFDEVLLLTLFDIILQISQELLKQTDLLDPKTQALHRLFLSYLREYQRAKKSALPSPEGTETSPGKKNKNTGGNGSTGKAKAPEKTQDATEKARHRISEREMLLLIKNNTPPGLLMKPFDAPPETPVPGKPFIPRTGAGGDRNGHRVRGSSIPA